MIINRLKLVQASVLMGLMLFLFSCATYNDRIAHYYDHIKSGNYVAANKDLDHNKLLQKDRNRLLYLLEKGKTYHLLHQPDSSNLYFNLADDYMEQQAWSDAKDVAVGTLVNPMMEKYRGEDFEKFMIHYYKALNYLYLNKMEDALVEARRISLQTQEQSNKFNDKTTRYSKDAFSMNLQGMLYEAGGDMNNAFIAYRNALETYLSSPTKTYYGVSLSKQLEKDVIRTAYLNGFQSDVDFYQRKFNIQYQPQHVSEGGELILFWENGLAPVKDEQEFFFSLLRGAGGVFYFSDPSGQMMIPFTGAAEVNMNGVNLNDFRSLRVTFPKYVPSPVYYTSATVSVSNTTTHLEKVEDINMLAIETLKQRFAKEMATTLSRVTIKKIAEYAVRGGKGNKGDDAASRELLAGAIQLYSLFSEKSDTRNWQTLPASIYYARIPLQRGKNEIQIKCRTVSGQDQFHTITVEGTGGITLYNYATLK